MSVNVDTVYQRVLAITNKEQRGYVTPQEFNLFANQAQMDIFEQYFYDINQFGRVKGNDTEYSDMLSILDEKLSFFEKTADLSQSGIYLVLPADLYRLGTVILELPSKTPVEAEYIQKNTFLIISKSPLTAPTDLYPVYTRDTGGIKIHSTTIPNAGAGEVHCTYTKAPSEVKWGYTIINDQALYNASTSTQFDVHESEETDLVIKILALAGILLQDPGMYQIAAAEDGKNTQQEKQ